MHGYSRHKKIKLFYVITQSEFGGAQKYVFLLSEYLKSDKYDIRVICGGNGELVNRLKEINIEVAPLFELKREINLLSDITAFLKLVGMFNKEKPDIVHSNSTKAGLLARLAARIAAVPVNIFTAHGFIFNEPMSKMKKLFYIILEWICGKCCDKIIAVSYKDKSSALESHIAKNENIEVIHHGLEPAEFTKLSMRDKKKQDYGFKDTDYLIGTIANFYKTKGIEYLVEAGEKVLHKHKNVKFVLVGEGVLKKSIECLIEKKKMKDNFVLTGYKNDAIEYLKIFDIFVLSSIKEGFPWIILEAMAAGKPIVATTVGGIPEMLEDKKEALLVPPANSDKLANSITKIIQDKKMANTLGENAKKRVGVDFHVEKMIKQTESIYKSVLLTKGGKYAD